MRRAWALAALCAACGGTQPSAAPHPMRVTPGELDTTGLLRPTAARAERAGAGGLALIAKGLLREGDRTGAFVEPAQPSNGSCLLVFARGAPSVTDVDLAIFADDGEPLAVDEEPDATPAVILCPPYPARMYVSARAASGEGLVAIGGQPVPSKTEGAVRAAISARGGVGVANRRVDQWPELERAARAELARLGPGAEETRRVGVPADRALTTTLSEEITAGSCASLLLFADPPVGSLDVEVQDQSGALVLRTARPSELAQLSFCSEAAQTLTVSLRPHTGRGVVGAIWYRLPREAASGARVLAARGEHPKLSDKERELDVELARRGATRAQRTAFALQPSAMATPDVNQLDVGRCSVWTALLPAVGARLRLTAFDPTHRELVARDGGTRAQLVTCGTPSAHAAIGVREAKGKGSLSVHELPGGIANADKAPAAASRVATLFYELGAAPARTQLVQGTSALSFEVPAGRCALLALGAERGAATLDAEEGKSEILTRGEAHTRWLRACADTTARRLELRLGAETGVFASALTPVPIP